MAFVRILSEIKSLFGPLVIQLVWYVLKQSFTSVSVKVVDIYLAASRLGNYPPHEWKFGRTRHAVGTFTSVSI